MSDITDLPPFDSYTDGDVPPVTDSLFDDHVGWVPPTDEEYVPIPDDAHEGGYAHDPADLPPLEDPGPSYNEVPDRTYDRGRGRGKNAVDPVLTEKVIETARDCLAAAHQRSGEEVVDMVQYILGSKNAMAQLSLTQLRTLKRVGEVFISIAADQPDDEFNLFELPDLAEAAGGVKAEISVLRARATIGDRVKNPTSTWRALCDHIQKDTAKKGANALIASIDQDLPADELMSLYTSLEPPTTQKTIMNASFSKSAADWLHDAAEAKAERGVVRISSGYRTLDFAMTAKDAAGAFAEPLGAWMAGEVHTLAAPSGNGKSSAVRKLITAAAEDLTIGWGHEHSKVLLAFTEESAEVVAEAAGLTAGQPFHHLASAIILADVGASRKRFIHSVWDLVIEAYHMSKATGLSIVDCGMPEMICLDYCTAIQEQGESETLASEVTMDLLLRGLAGWRIREMEQFTGESFAAYAGMSWPAGMETFKPAVLTFAQFRKIDGAMFYDSATCNVEDFVVENEQGMAGWKVEETDFRVPRIADIRGSGKVVQHSDSILLLHRSRPTAAKFKDPVTGRYRLNDDRARWIFLKTRNSADLRFIPMRFDSNATGKRGQFYDLLAEKAIEAGVIEPLPSFTQSGDPILPARPQRSPFDGIAY